MIKSVSSEHFGYFCYTVYSAAQLVILDFYLIVTNPSGQPISQEEQVRYFTIIHCGQMKKSHCEQREDISFWTERRATCILVK